MVPRGSLELGKKEAPMPLRDHFRPPVENRHSWDELHGMWPAVIVQQLFPILPEGYVAAPRVHLGTAFEIDVSRYLVLPDGTGPAAAHAADLAGRRPGRVPPSGNELRRHVSRA